MEGTQLGGYPWPPVRKTSWESSLSEGRVWHTTEARWRQMSLDDGRGRNGPRWDPLPRATPQTAGLLAAEVFPGGSNSKEFAYKTGGPGSILGLGKSPGERNGNPLQYSCLENTMDRKAWWATALLQSSWIGGLQSMGSQRVGHN